MSFFPYGNGPLASTSLATSADGNWKDGRSHNHHGNQVKHLNQRHSEIVVTYFDYDIIVCPIVWANDNVLNYFIFNPTM